ncbi:MAG: tripartite tricarboxylate transporter substrate binding protein [Burkholderiales bacterium]|nr:tripartite tricarboxylate transporter substrate binding protein [Burkholderiales bacterium]
MTAPTRTAPRNRHRTAAGWRRLIVATLLAPVGLPLLVPAALLAPGPAQAQAWPAKTVRIIVPAAPGGSADPLARLVAEELGRSLGQTFVVENKPGANGNVGAVAAVKSPPDGYTLMLGWAGTLVSAVTLYHAKPYHPQKDLDLLVLIGSLPNIVVAHPSLPTATLAELASHAKARPGQLNFGSTGSGSSYHLSGELFKKITGTFMVHVPYTSPGAVFTDLVANRLQLAFPGVAAAAPLVKDGRLRALAVMADKRSEVLPEVPTAREAGMPALLSETWFGLVAPKGTPPEVVAKVNEVVNTALNTPAFRTRLVGMGYTPLGGSPERFATVLDDDIRKWAEVVKFSGAKVD